MNGTDPLAQSLTVSSISWTWRKIGAAKSMSHLALKSQSSLSTSELINHVKSTQQSRCHMQISVCCLFHSIQLPLHTADHTYARKHGWWVWGCWWSHQLGHLQGHQRGGQDSHSTVQAPEQKCTVFKSWNLPVSICVASHQLLYPLWATVSTSVKCDDVNKLIKFVEDRMIN